MRRGGRLFIILGIGLALIAGLLATVSFIGGGGGDGKTNKEDQVPIVQAARDISANSVLREEDLQLVEVDKSTASPGAAVNTTQVIGLAVNGNIVKGQQILTANLQTPGLTNIVADGKRAVAIPLDRVNALGGLIRTDDHVDIVYSARVELLRILPTNIAEIREDGLFTFDEEAIGVPPADQRPPANYPYPGEAGSRFIIMDDGEGSPTAKLVLQNMRVLRVIAGDVAVATDNPVPETSEESEKKTNVNGDKLPSTDLLVLEVDPQQAEVIRFMMETQIQPEVPRYQVLLRNTQDSGSAQTNGITYDKLMTDYGLPAPKSVRMPGGGDR